MVEMWRRGGSCVNKRQFILLVASAAPKGDLQGRKCSPKCVIQGIFIGVCVGLKCAQSRECGECQNAKRGFFALLSAVTPLSVSARANLTPVCVCIPEKDTDK